MKKGRWWLIGLATALLIIIGIGGKQYMDKKAIEKDYQQGIDLIQKYVSNYLVENYEGIEKIEWQDVGVEWRNAKGYGTSLLGNYVKSDVRIFVSKTEYFTIRHNLTKGVTYDNDLQKYVLKESMNSKNTDKAIILGKENTIKKLGFQDIKFFEKFKKSNTGSANAKIIYNLNIYELKY